MRNPVRLKNLSFRFLPLYVAGLLILVWYPPALSSLVWGLPLIAIGAGLRGWGAGHLVKNHALTTRGPYAHLRHPLYLGTILIATGFAIALGGRLALLVLLGVWPWFVFRYFPRKEASESRRLESLYGEHFVRYRSAVPALRPRIRPWRGLGNGERATSEPGWTLDRYSENNELGTLLAIGAGVLVFWMRAVATG